MGQCLDRVRILGVDAHDLRVETCNSEELLLVLIFKLQLNIIIIVFIAFVAAQ